MTLRVALFVGAVGFLGCVAQVQTYLVRGSDRDILALETLDADGSISARPYGTYYATRDRVVGVGNFDTDLVPDVVLERTRPSGIRELLVYCHHPARPTNYVRLMRLKGWAHDLSFGLGTCRVGTDAGLSLFAAKVGAARITAISWRPESIAREAPEVERIRNYSNPGSKDFSVLGGVADFNGDGEPDFVLRDPVRNILCLSYANAGTWLHSRPIRDSSGIASIHPTSVVVGATDVDGDGAVDILVQPTEPVPTGNPRPTRVWYLHTKTTPRGAEPFQVRNDPVTYRGKRFTWDLLAVGSN